MAVLIGLVGPTALPGRPEPLGAARGVRGGTEPRGVERSKKNISIKKYSTRISKKNIYWLKKYIPNSSSSKSSNSTIIAAVS